MRFLYHESWLLSPEMSGSAGFSNPDFRFASDDRSCPSGDTPDRGRAKQGDMPWAAFQAAIESGSLPGNAGKSTWFYGRPVPQSCVRPF